MFDVAKSKALKVGANLVLRAKGLGEIEYLDLNTTTKRLEARLFLAGESESITVTIEKYAIEESSDPPQVTCRSIRVSREWMHRLAQERVTGKSVRVPPEFVGLLKLLL